MATSRVVLQWDRAEPALVVLVTGPEELLAERAIARIVHQVRLEEPEVELTRIDASASYEAGRLGLVAGPSLFAERALVVVESVAAADDSFLAEAQMYVVAPEVGAVVIFRHGGGVRGRKLLETARQAGYPEVGCPAITRDADKVQFAMAEFRRAERLVEGDAVRMLLEAVGADLRELASACAQLVADTTGKITVDQVERYYGGRVETTSFVVADAAMAGQTGQALALARHAMATGVAPVVLVAALASKLRTLAKVGGARRRGLDPVQDLGLAPFAVTRARKDVGRWDGERLGSAIRAVAQADAGVKGAGRDPRYAVERAIIAVSRAASKR